MISRVTAGEAGNEAKRRIAAERYVASVVYEATRLKVIIQ
jgi:hypothetical protein